MVPQQYPHLDTIDSLYCTEETDFHEHHFHSEENCFLEQDLFWETDELASLLSREKPNELYKTLRTSTCVDDARRVAVEWMLKVNAHYSFSALTAILAVDFFDRFLSSFQLQIEKPWISRLIAVACISLAAKVEETQVPLLLDLQVEESKYLFDAKTVKKMEILVLSTLQWRMNPVTPLSFVDYIARRLGFKGQICLEMLRQCEEILLSVILYSSFTSFLPSVLATATMLHVFKSMEDSIDLEHQNHLLDILGSDKDNVDKCCKLISDIMVQNQSKKRKFGSIPGSPNSIIDMSFSSDSSNDSWSVASSVSSSPEPLSKKTRAQDQLLLPATNFLNISR